MQTTARRLRYGLVRKLISLFLAVAIIAATCGYIGSAVVRRNKRRTRGYFILGFFCGFMAGTILCRTRRGTERARNRRPVR